MRDCEAIGPDGKMYFCSRQMAANDTELLPAPEENECIDIRNFEGNLDEELKRWYGLQYISKR